MENILNFINKSSKLFLENEIKREKENGTYIFYSRDNSNLDIALYFCSKILCKDDKECLASFHKMVHIIEAKEEQLKVEDIKNVITESSKFSFNLKQFFIIDINNIREEGWNMLLKTLEEPINSFFILLSSKENIPLTLKSRALMVDVSSTHFYNEQLYKFFNGNLKDCIDFKLSLDEIKNENLVDIYEKYIKDKNINNKATLIKSIKNLIDNIESVEEIEKINIAEKLESFYQKDKKSLKEVLDLIADNYIKKKPNNYKNLLFIKDSLKRNCNLNILLINFFLCLK